ncbi:MULTISPECIES: RnfABCDGE type electron transport complex subunit G [unclassified Pseudomonas]|uniref:RnfABCDGE type electron transport complex subunit G n=1 Tax=unclassified Pseudomonas TaxID=196821 RepID=UPI001644489E|nr:MULTISPECIES: RnfABCDGE type electron transport complex subunit G [unclassified Pseudomonas]MBC3421642.1 RnfABCDGE type electron transport complex subunit G [Pseudomonas sp. RW3S2]MBC3468169.1 RnfABCDGE type electron transport complex subunit G [Pseudomonas sp. RW10S2]
MNARVRDLLLLALVTTLAVAATLAWRQWTAAPIADAARELQEQQWLAVLPPQRYDNAPLQAPLPIASAQLQHSQLLGGYRATLAGTTSAIVLRSQIQGYAGPIMLSIAIDPNGRLIATRVLMQEESPGLGGQLGDPASHWLEQFDRQGAAANWALKRDKGDFDQLAGATVTSRAVMAALQDALRYFDAQRSSLLEHTSDE